MTKPTSFWDERFAREDYVYGVQPNAFVREAAERWLTPQQDVLVLGAGEGRNAVHLARLGHTVTAADYSVEGLRKTERLAQTKDVAVQTVEADVRSWIPDRRWDAVVITFLHLADDERYALYRLIHQVLRPGGHLIAEWFRPEQRTEGYTSGGPPSPDMMVTPEELRAHFDEAGIETLESVEPILDEGMHTGPGATVRFVWRWPEVD